MIISASRRTDIPAFYSKWFINRIRAGYCRVPNPFNANQVAHVSLAPGDVDAIVFWTRNPRPLFPYLQELNERGFRYYFQYTLIGYPRLIDPHSPPVETAIATLHALAGQVGPQRVVWRYDPILLTEVTPADYHLEAYARLAQALHGATCRSVISFLDVYNKAKKRLAEMGVNGAALTWTKPALPDWLGGLAGDLAKIANREGMEIASCAETLDLRPFGVRPGKCIDDDLLQNVFGLEVSHAKDPSQRAACGCVVSKDIGMYDCCQFGCRYCYATSSFERARANHQRHDPLREALLPPP